MFLEVDPPQLMKKLAWTLETIAPPTLKPFNPALSISSPAETAKLKVGFRNTDPALRSPTGCDFLRLQMFLF